MKTTLKQPFAATLLLTFALSSSALATPHPRLHRTRVYHRCASAACCQAAAPAVASGNFYQEASHVETLHRVPAGQGSVSYWE